MRTGRGAGHGVEVSASLPRLAEPVGWGLLNFHVALLAPRFWSGSEGSQSAPEGSRPTFHQPLLRVKAFSLESPFKIHEATASL